MKNILIIILLFLAHPTYSQSWQWAARFGGIGTDPNNFNPDEYIRDMVVDNEGNVYFCGRVMAASNANGIPLTTYGIYDLIIGKLDCHGNLVWVKTAGSGGGDQANSICMDDAGNLYVTGTVFGTVNNPLNFFGTIITETTVDLFIVKMDTSGTILWSKIAAPGDQTMGSEGFRIRMDDNQNLNMVFRSSNPSWPTCPSCPGILFPGDTVSRGWWQATMDTAGTVLSKFLVAYDIIGFSKFDYAPGPNGDHYFLTTMRSVDSATIGGQVVHYMGLNTSGNILFIKFDPSGNLQWIEHIWNANNMGMSGERLLVNQDDEIFISGSIFNGHVFGNDTMFNTVGINSRIFPFIAKYNNQGQSLWGTNASTNHHSNATGGVAILPNGNLVWAGYFWQDAEFGPFAVSPATTGNRDFFVCELDPDGTIVGLEVPSCSGFNEYPHDIKTDALGNVYLAGAYNGTFDMNGNTYTSAGGRTDGFVAKLGYICTVGVDEYGTETPLSLSLYPNPVSEWLHVITNSAAGNELTIFNLLGEKVMEITTNNSYEPVIKAHVAHLPPGVYLVQLAGKNGVAAGKFVKM